ncbi:MAG: His-Xaa-Ser system radical SAM maturase HxsB [archaeon]|nr:MAG: His-Xaa-Ser system radical SAM maturase HxsB [archaeon]
MAFTMFPQTVKENYTLNFYRNFSFGRDKTLLTTDHGAWVLLDDQEYQTLRSHKVHENPQLFGLLKERGIVVTEESFEKLAKDYRERFYFLFSAPTLHIIVPTFRCNMNCVYCHSVAKPVEEGGFDMNEDTAKSVVDFILKTPPNFLSMEFQGGECLLNFEIVKFIIEYAEKEAQKKNKKLGFKLVTNLAVMNEEILEFLKKHNIVGICTSFDGPKEVHDKNRRYFNQSGTYDDVVYWIKRINKEFGKYFSLGSVSTVTRHSLKYPKEIVDEYYKLGFRSIWPRFMNNLGYANQKWEDIGYTADEFLKFYREILGYIMKMNRKNKWMVEGYSYYFGEKILNRYDTGNVDLRSPCGAGIGQLTYDHEGDIFTCDEAKVLGEEFKIGNVKENNLKEVIENPVTVSMMNISSKLPLICDKCAFSPYCAVCPVNFYVTQKNIVPKLSNEFRCKIYKEIIKTLFKKILFSEEERNIIIKWLNLPPIPREKVVKRF